LDPVAADFILVVLELTLFFITSVDAVNCDKATLPDVSIPKLISVLEVPFTRKPFAPVIPFR
jgi:hypothetical protein